MMKTLGKFITKIFIDMCTHYGVMVNKLNIPVFVPCGMCIECRNMRREDFTQRLMHEYETQGYIGSFITLTYRNEELPLLLPEGSAVVGTIFKNTPPAFGSTLYRPDISQFCDKLSKRVHRKFNHGIKYICVGEYGDDEHRPHYHGIIIGLPCSERNMIYECWNKGRVDIAPVTHADIRYTLGYIDKQIFGSNKLYDAYGDFQPPFAHFSKGIGQDWIKQNIDKFDEYGTIHLSENKSYTLPPYYLDKFRFKKKTDSVISQIPESIKKFMIEHKCDLKTAFEKRSKLVDETLAKKCLASGEGYLIWKNILDLHSDIDL